MTLTSTSQQGRTAPIVWVAYTSFLLLPFLVIPGDTLRGAMGATATNLLASLLVGVLGVAVLRVMWALEYVGSSGAIPYAWSYFAVQHVVFGFGALLVSTFDPGYVYSNSHGTFVWADAVLPLMLVHGVSLMAGLAGSLVASRNQRGNNYATDLNCRAWGDTLSRGQINLLCYVSLFLHGLVWVILARVELSPGLRYAVGVFAGPQLVAFVLWGLLWRRIGGRWVFLAYSAAYAILQVIQGNRSYFLLPAVLFAIGRLISGDLRKRIWRPIIRLAPLGLVLMWGIVRSEELRVIFERTANSNDTVERLQSLSTGQSSAVDVTDGSGIRMNAIFRVGSRLFELSATDVISRTPSAIPYWGWEDEDWSVLFSALLPLRFNKDAAIWTSERNYCFFLREYGWYIDPFAETGSSGTSMPATLVADSWRRFGWVGVIVWFVFWGWFLRNVTKLLNPSRRSLLMLIFSGALLSDLPNYYTYDIISLVTILPRRCMVLFAFALGMSAIIAMAQSKRADLGGGRMAKRLGIGSAMRQVGA